MIRPDRLASAIVLAIAAAVFVFCASVGAERAERWRVVNQESIR